MYPKKRGSRNERRGGEGAASGTARAPARDLFRRCSCSSGATDRPSREKTETVFPPRQFSKGIPVAVRGEGSGSKSFLEANEKDKGKQMTLFQIQPQLGLYHVEFNSSFDASTMRCRF